MQICIPSHKRSHLMTTFKHLPPYLRDIVTIYVYPEELQDYKDFPSVTLPEGMRGIANKRNYILQTCTDPKLVILDDDLVFATRREDEPTKFRPSDHEDLVAMLEAADRALDRFAHGAIAGREGGNRDTNPYKFNTRAMRAHFFRADILKDEGFTLNGTKFMSDFDTTLNLLEAGWGNVLLNEWVTNQAGSNTEGGCSTTRSLADLADAAYELHDRHPRFVTVVKKTTKAAWGGGERTDVRVQWKQAYASAKEERHVTAP